MDGDALRRAMTLYAITDRLWLAGRSLESVVDQALRAGVTCLQLREKNADPIEEARLARSLRDVCLRYGVPFIVNDHLDIALSCDADGVHVGQSDCSCSQARSLLGAEKIVGVSVQTVDQALRAQREGADYLGVGALYRTSTKPEAADVGLQEVRAICDAVDIPVVGIGGLNGDTVGTLRHSGLDGVAVVSAVFAADDITRATIDLRRRVVAALELEDGE